MPFGDAHFLTGSDVVAGVEHEPTTWSQHTISLYPGGVVEVPICLTPLEFARRILRHLPAQIRPVRVPPRIVFRLEVVGHPISVTRRGHDEIETLIWKRHTMRVSAHCPRMHVSPLGFDLDPQRGKAEMLQFVYPADSGERVKNPSRRLMPDENPDLLHDAVTELGWMVHEWVTVETE